MIVYYLLKPEIEPRREFGAFDLAGARPEHAVGDAGENTLSAPLVEALGWK